LLWTIPLMALLLAIVAESIGRKATHSSHTTLVKNRGLERRYRVGVLTFG